MATTSTEHNGATRAKQETHAKKTSTVSKEREISKTVSRPYYKQYEISLKNTVDNFKAGKTRNAVNEWRKITNDKWILETICGYKVTLSCTLNQSYSPRPFNFKIDEKNQIKMEIQRFLNHGIIEKANGNTEGEYISNIFTRPKSDGRIRIILNLMEFNKQYVEKVHFKMETLQSAITAMRQNCYFGSVDISDAYYTIPIGENADCSVLYLKELNINLHH